MVGTLACSALFAQQSTQPALRPVDPGVADTGPLNGPGRVQPVDMRQPSQFDRVYEVEIDGKRYFARGNGAMTAVFDRSNYVNYGGRAFPVVPAGTKFYIGRIPNSPPPDSGPPSKQSAAFPVNLSNAAKILGTSVDLSAAGVNQPQAPASASDSQSATSNLWQSESYRIRRTSQLIDLARALRAHAAELPPATPR